MIKMTLVFLYTFLFLSSTTTAGFCFSPYNENGSGILCFEPSPYSQEIRSVDRNELKNLWFYDVALTAEEDIVYINHLGIRIEAHNLQSKTYEAMITSRQNVEHIWVYVQYLKPGQQVITNPFDFELRDIPRFDATHYRTVPIGEVAFYKNMLLAEFKNVKITVSPGEKVVLSFFGRFKPDAPFGTKIKGENLVPTWGYSGRNMKFSQNNLPASIYILN